MNKDPIEFYFDFTSPYSYLASEKIDALAAKFGRKVKWRPMLLGAAFPKTGGRPLTEIPLKGEYSVRDFARSARHLGVAFKMPSRFPLSTQQAGRAYYWLHDQDCAKARQFAHAAFRALFVADRDISDTDIILDLATEVGADRGALAAALVTAELKQRLRSETEAAIAKGMFGAPYILIDGEPFWGADRLPQIEHWLQSGGF
jgi:2-hydroxychromene-2-carboxylate isomerase